MRSCHFENRYYSTDQMLSEYVHRVLCRKIVLFGAPIALVALIFAMLSWLDRDTVFFHPVRRLFPHRPSDRPALPYAHAAADERGRPQAPQRPEI